MKKGKLTILGALEEGTEECSLCTKTKEGLVVQQEDGTQLNWCWACAKKLIRMRRLSKSNGAQNGS